MKPTCRCEGTPCSWEWCSCLLSATPPRHVLGQPSGPAPAGQARSLLLLPPPPGPPAPAPAPRPQDVPTCLARYISKTSIMVGLTGMPCSVSVSLNATTWAASSTARTPCTAAVCGTSLRARPGAGARTHTHGGWPAPTCIPHRWCQGHGHPQQEQRNITRLWCVQLARTGPFLRPRTFPIALTRPSPRGRTYSAAPSSHTHGALPPGPFLQHVRRQRLHAYHPLAAPPTHTPTCWHVVVCGVAHHDSRGGLEGLEAVVQHQPRAVPPALSHGAQAGQAHLGSWQQAGAGVIKGSDRGRLYKLPLAGGQEAGGRAQRGVGGCRLHLQR